MPLKICLIGSIPKGDNVRKDWKDWKVEYKEKLSQIPNIEFSDGDAWRDETKSLQLVGHDSLHRLTEKTVRILKTNTSDTVEESN